MPDASSVPTDPGAGLSAPSLPAQFQARATERGTAPALFFKSGGRWVAISWSEYALAVQRLSNALLSWGLAPDDKVAIWSVNRPEWHIADLAASHCAAVSAGLYPSVAPAQALYQLNQSEARVVVVEGMPQARQLAAVKSELPGLRKLIVVEGHDKSLGDWAVSWNDALAAGEAFGRSRPGLFDATWRSVVPDSVYTLVYTSGTTGPSKGAIVTHRNFIWTVDQTMLAAPLTGEDRLLSYLALSHIAERVATHGRHVRSGCRVYFCTSIDRLVEELREVRPSYFFGVPRVYEKVYAGIRSRMAATTGARKLILDWALRVGERASAAKQAGRRPGPLLATKVRLADRLVFHGIRARLGLDQARGFSVSTAPVSPDILRFFDRINIEIDEIYGQTEDTGPATYNPRGRPRFGTAGIPFPGTEVKLAEDGEILIRGPHVFQGYYRMPEETAAVLHDGWLRTGDVGTFDASGYLLITDRKKELIKTAGGKYVAPAAMEATLRQHPLVSQAVVLGERRPYVAALLTLNPEALETFAREQGLEGTPTAALASVPAVRAQLQAAVDAANASVSHPEQIKRWAVLPEDFQVGDELTPTAKLKRKAVAEKYARQIDELYASGDRAAS